MWGITFVSILSRGCAIRRLHIPDRISPSTAVDDDVGLHKSGIIYKIRMSFLWRTITRRTRGAPSTVGQRKKVTAVTFFPARPRPDQRGTNTGQTRRVSVDEIAWFLVYRMDETISQLSANNGILVCLVREIWQFKVFAGKEVTALPATCWRRGRRLLWLKLNSFVFFKMLEIKWLRTYYLLVIRTSKHIWSRKVAR